MPFQSEKQRRFLHANHPEIAKRWEREYATGGISNHFRKKFASGTWTPGAGRDTKGYQKSHPSYGGGNGGTGGDGPKPHSGPTAAELAAAKAAAAAAKAKAEAEKRTLEVAARKKYLADFKDTQKKKTKHSKKLKELSIDPFVSLEPEFLDKDLMEKYRVKGNINKKVKFTPYKDILETHPAYPALDLSKVRIGNIDDPRDLEGGYHKDEDITSLSSKYTNPDKMTRFDLEKLMHETTHRSMNVDPAVVDVLGVGGKNINYTKGNWEYNPEEFGFTGPVQYPKDTSEIFTRRVDVDAWDGKGRIAGQGEFMTDLEVADAAKADRKFHDPILDRKTGVHWQTRGEGAAPGESLRARKGIRGVFDPYVDQYKGAMENYTGGENYFTDVEIPAFEEAKRLKTYLSNKAKGGVARKNYYHGGILDINESEEIISDDGNDIELTDYNAAFDEPTGVKSLFQAKDGGRIGYANGPPGGGETSLGSGAAYSGGASDRGPREDPDRFGPVSKPQTVPEGINIHGGPTVKEALRLGELKKMANTYEDEWGKWNDKYDKLNKYSYTGSGVTKRAKLTDQNYNEDRAVLEKKFGKSLIMKILGALVLGMPISIGYKDLKAVYGMYELEKKYKVDMQKLKDISIDKGWATSHHAVDTPMQTIDQLMIDTIKVRDDDDTGGDGPIYDPVTGAVDEEYAQGYYNDGMSDLDKIRAGQAKRAMINPDWQQQPGLAYGQQLFNSGGLANLFRVKNQ